MTYFFLPGLTLRSIHIYTRIYIHAIQGLIKVNNTQICDSYELVLEGLFFFIWNLNDILNAG